MQRYNDTNTPMIALVGFVGAIVLFVLVIGLQVLYYAYVERSQQVKVIAIPTVASDTELAEQDIKLAQYGWIDRQKNQVAIPIGRAMEIVVSELQSSAAAEGAKR